LHCHSPAAAASAAAASIGQLLFSIAAVSAAQATPINRCHAAAPLCYAYFRRAV